VRKALEAEAAKMRQAEASAEEEAELGYVLTAKGRKALYAWRAEQELARTGFDPRWIIDSPEDEAWRAEQRKEHEQRERRETSSRRVQSFSILKA
jgi:DNA-binding PadR family transcriptional regulator